MVRTELNVSHKSTDGMFRDYCDGIIFIEHPIFKAHPNALQFILYYDDVEVANPLGSKAGIHKLGALLCYEQKYCLYIAFYTYHIRCILLHNSKCSTSLPINTQSDTVVSSC